MILAIETTALCIVFFLLCFLGTGTDEKNLKNYSSYPDEVQNLINEIAEYRGRYKEHSKVMCTPKVRHFWRCIFYGKKRAKAKEV